MRRTLFTALSVIALLATGLVAGYAAGGTGTVDPPPRIAFLANGINPADALAAGGIAGQLGAPLFTTRPDALEQAASDGLEDYEPDLLIVLGGPVAIAQPVMDAAAAAAGLTVVTDADARPDEGAIRVAGNDRYLTAAAVASLLSDYDVAYLPVDATALGALDADTATEADNADTLDGIDSTGFALSDQACTAGQVVTGIAADGTPTCADDAIDGGDADTRDGVDSTELVPLSLLDGLLPIATFHMTNNGTMDSAAFRAPLTGPPAFVGIHNSTDGRYRIELPGFNFSASADVVNCNAFDGQDHNIVINGVGTDLLLDVYDDAGSYDDVLAVQCSVYERTNSARSVGPDSGSDSGTTAADRENG